MTSDASAAEQPCPLATALDAMGGKWSLRILYQLVRGSCHFNELQRLNPGISHKVLTETLRHLEAEHLVTRSVVAGPVVRVQYALSSDGESVRPVLDAMITWGNARLRTPVTQPESAAGPQRR